MSDIQQFCINCGISARQNIIGMRQLEDEGILSVIQQWLAPQMVKSSHHICQACRHLAASSLSKDEIPSLSFTGHRQVCVNCGRSVLRKRSHTLRSDTEQENKIRLIIREWISPRNIPSDRSLICHSCWGRANKEARHFISGPSTSSTNHEQEETQLYREAKAGSHSTQRKIEVIVLPEYVRALETESHCFVHKCHRKQRNRIPLGTRIMLLNDFNFYVPKNNRLCNFHAGTQSWDFLIEALDDYLINTFTASHIQDMLLLKSQKE